MALDILPYPVAVSVRLAPVELRYDRAIPDGANSPFDVRIHARYNPAANTSLAYSIDSTQYRVFTRPNKFLFRPHPRHLD